MGRVGARGRRKARGKVERALIVTFVDAGVLIAATRGDRALALRALTILGDPDRTFASSPFLRLEVLPKALFHRRTEEVSFLEAYFGRVEVWAAAEPDLVVRAEEEARVLGLSALDALHVAAAIATGSTELVTTEKPGRPLHRSRLVPVRSIYPSL